MLRVQDEEERHVLFTSCDLVLGEGVEANIVVSNTQDEWNEPIAAGMGVDWLEERVEVVPAAVAGPHSVIIGRVPSDDDHIRRVSDQIQSHLLACRVHTQVAADCHLQLLRIGPWGCLIVRLLDHYSSPIADLEGVSCVWLQVGE